MAIRVTLDEIQQWLSNSKYPIEEVDEALEETGRTLVFSALQNTFDTSTWVDATTTPALVRKIISLWIASMEWARGYAEDDTGGSTYFTFLQDLYNSLLAGVIAGGVELIEVPGESSDTLSIDFYPTDTEDWDEDNWARFSIGQVF
jgi:hypothetical protein